MGITLNSALVCDNSTLANFKAWASAISAFLQTAGSGLSQTTDTGQVNWSTIASVPTSGNYVYEMYKNTDALTTFYFKIEYGTGSSSSNPKIRLSIGTGTNGAGALTGFVTTLNPFTMPGSDTAPPSTSTQYNCYFSAAPGRLSILMWRDCTTTTWPLWFGATYTISSGNMPYGVSKTYIGTKNGLGFTQAACGHSGGLSNACAFLAEYD